MPTDREVAEVEAANRSNRPPLVFVHGLWLLASSWDPWRRRFEELGYSTLAPGWPDDPETVAQARERPEVLAGKTVGQITDHLAGIIGQLRRKPVVIGHSLGGLVTQKLAGMGLSAGSVAISPAPFRGVLPVPISALKASSPVLRKPGNRKLAIELTYDQFRFAFANAVDEAEARSLYDAHAVAASGAPLFQAALANLNPRTEASVDTKRADRGPLLIISGGKDNTVPWAIANASFKRYKLLASSTRIVEMPGRGHSLTIDSGWPGVAEVAIDFLDRHVPRS
jgi:non-heme chloroperoxidase